jgi:hypothetical protein
VRDRAKAPVIGMMSLTKTVPAVVPLLFYSSLPLVPLLATKYNVPLTFLRVDGAKVQADAEVGASSNVPTAILLANMGAAKWLGNFGFNTFMAFSIYNSIDSDRLRRSPPTQFVSGSTLDPKITIDR